jgi:hypothetical protein
MQVEAKITGIKYQPFLCKDLIEVDVQELEKAIESNSQFLLKLSEKNKVAISWWVSAKRTRSYPYPRVYNTLSFAGKRITIIPFYKDEGKEGDRDFLQWDTISLMSLLGVYVIIGYYVRAEKSTRYEHKITNQRFDYKYLLEKINCVVSYQSDALHWNLEQVSEIDKLGPLAIQNYQEISKKLSVEMHSTTSAKRRMEKLIKSKDAFMTLSRNLAKQAQHRESVTLQPKENLSGEKGIITIKNYLGGYYFFTADEIRIEENIIKLVEAKHSKGGNLPSEDDIKDGLLKMILFTNLVEVKIDDKNYTAIAVLKLTAGDGIKIENFNAKQKELFALLQTEAKTNNFRVELS